MAAGDMVATALIAPDRAWIFADDPRSWDPAAPAAGPLASVVRQLRVDGLAPGAWRVELWDPVAGAVVATQDSDAAADGSLVLSAPTLPVAWKLIRIHRLLPALAIPQVALPASP